MISGNSQLPSPVSQANDKVSGSFVHPQLKILKLKESCRSRSRQGLLAAEKPLNRGTARILRASPSSAASLRQHVNGSRKNSPSRAFQSSLGIKLSPAIVCALSESALPRSTLFPRVSPLASRVSPHRSTETPKHRVPASHSSLPLPLRDSLAAFAPWLFIFFQGPHVKRIALGPTRGRSPFLGNAS
jgi:hypothetical protein